MIKTLLRKQMLELYSSYFIDKKTGKKRSQGGIIGLFVLFGFLFLYLAFIFFMMNMAMTTVLIPMGISWLPLSISGILALALGIFGSVFNTYAAMYSARDNDFMLSMPIPPGKLLLSRLAGVGIMSLIFAGIVWIPALIGYIAGGGSILALPCGLVTFIGIVLVVMGLTCILGWVIAVIARKLKHKSFITLIISVVFLAAYMYVCMKAGDFLESIADIGVGLSEGMMTKGFFFYWMGLSASGNLLYLLIFTAICLGFFGLVYLVLSRTFIKIITTKSAGKKVKYVEKSTVQRSLRKTLLFKEWKRFYGSAGYILNAGLGSVFMLVIGVLSIIKADALGNIIDTLTGELIDISPYMPLFLAGIVCLGASTNVIAAPSVSLEGKSIWALQTLPIDLKEVMSTKILLHIYVTLIPALFQVIAMGLALRMSGSDIALTAVVVTVFVYFDAAWCMMMGLLKPNLTWINENNVIKQGMAVTLGLLGGWGFVFVMGILFFAGGALLNTSITLVIMILILAVFALLIQNWINKKGIEIFARL